MRTETAHIIQMMKATGNQAGIIERWKNLVEEWASRNGKNDPDAAAAVAWIPAWQARPFYTAAELAPMWPALAIVTGFTTKWPAVTKSAKRLEHELDFYGLPRLEFVREYFICERIHHWRNASREEIMREIPHAFG